MNARQTSIDCYNEIKNSGLLSKRRFETFEAIMKIAPCTASEVQHSINYNNGGRDCMKRISELRDRGVIYEKDVRPCKVTGKNVIEWDLTDRLPVNIKNPNKTKKQRLNAALNSLRELYKNKDISTDEDWKLVADLIKSI
mgnify:FL=1|jgi:hypothetical protein|tara:strand:- start:152 stop:571 length:420 start_codon:yes stop_codon:yes gene_type:complete